MSGGQRCHCGQRDAWRVTIYRGNYSAFSGYHFTPSDYSEVVCHPALGGCGTRWRTKAAYVDQLPHGPADISLTDVAPVCDN